MELLPATKVPPLNYQETVSGLEDKYLEVIHEDSYSPIAGVSMDSRDLFFGEMFLALDGVRFLGLDFIPSAYAKGVRTFVLANRYRSKLETLPEDVYHRSCFFLVTDPVVAFQNLAKYYLGRMGGLRIAITGSAGKTTTKKMLGQLLGVKRKDVFCSYKNENNHLGVPKNIFSLQRQLVGGDFISVMIFELGMNHFGEIDRLASLIKPHLAIITNILYAHIGNFSCREDLVRAKGEIISHLVQHKFFKDKPGGLLVVPHDIFGKEYLLSKAASTPKPPDVIEVSPTITTECAFFSENHRRGFRSLWKDTRSGVVVEAPGLSTFMDPTLSLVLAVGETLGTPPQESLRSLAQILNEETISDQKKIPLAGSRLFIIDIPKKPLVIDDSYNSNPDSVILVVSTLFSLVPKLPSEIRLRLVLGDMLELGDFSSSLHKKCGVQIENQVKKLPLEDQKRIGLFFLGHEMKVCYDNIAFPFTKHYEKSPDQVKNLDDPSNRLLQDLWEECDMNSIVFFKASRGMQFDRLINLFLKGIPSFSI